MHLLNVDMIANEFRINANILVCLFLLPICTSDKATS